MTVFRLFAAAAVVFVGLSCPVLAQDTGQGPRNPLDAEALDRLTLGRTFIAVDPVIGPYGVSTYLPGQKVLWRDGEGCLDAQWSQTPGQSDICFTFDALPDERHCWHFGIQDEKLAGWPLDYPDDPPVLFEESDTPVQCLPHVGV